MFFIDQLNLLFLFINIISRCFAGTSPRGTRKEVNQALASRIRSLNLDSDDEEDKSQHESARPPSLTQVHGTFSDDEDEGHGASSTDRSSRISTEVSFHRRPKQFTLSESESDDESSFQREQMSGTSGFGSDSLSIDQSDSDRSRFLFDQSIDGRDPGTLVGLESPIGPKIAGGTPTLGLSIDPSKLFTRHGWKKFQNEPRFLASSPGDRRSPKKFFVPETPSYGSVSFDDFLSPPPRTGPFGSGPVASLNELYHSPTGGFNLDKNLWPQEDRRYIKAPNPPLAPGSIPVGVMSVKGREIPREFLQVVEFGRKNNNKALSKMIWKKTFISGNSATVYGIELNGENLILKITKHNYIGGSRDNEIPQCVHENDIESLHKSDEPCNHKPKNGLIQKSSCSADPNLVPFEYYIAEKVALTRGFMPAAASIPNTFAKDQNAWYLIFEELPGISPLKYSENILERLAKPLIRQQLEALKQIAHCHIMHLDAHWGNILYSRERGIQFIDFGIATLVDRFELLDSKATLIITFTFDRCLDCEASKLGRDFQHLIKNNYPIDGHTLLSHPWLQY
ncbi:unnamed protein product [Rotaria sp. Silwood2]|nr:unnamed protein product [Rotaria sp. Silwood2]CAF2622057.1 unnamed protein product [Rotaria sp. Silwood2]CAF3028231.1 unnamed protein product [Rotaria sp. Silwood2]CAF4270649.1 unnamed protein product [Rotaria sp. Silwood2]CAF4278345.1 unnamed protein product [Rotaria sp. Silwood2]